MTFEKIRRLAAFSRAVMYAMVGALLAGLSSAQLGR
jgi:hypothetical protein